MIIDVSSWPTRASAEKAIPAQSARCHRSGLRSTVKNRRMLEDRLMMRLAS